MSSLEIFHISIILFYISPRAKDKYLEGRIFFDHLINTCIMYIRRVTFYPSRLPSHVFFSAWYMKYVRSTNCSWETVEQLLTLTYNISSRYLMLGWKPNIKVGALGHNYRDGFNIRDKFITVQHLQLFITWFIHLRRFIHIIKHYQSV